MRIEGAEAGGGGDSGLEKDAKKAPASLIHLPFPVTGEMNV